LRKLLPQGDDILGDLNVGYIPRWTDASLLDTLYEASPVFIAGWP
jgi:hypothetical protein